MIEGKRIVLVDDSIVRGTTSKKIVKMMRDAGAKEVHMRIASPPTPIPLLRHRHAGRAIEAAGLARMTVEEMAEFIGVDSWRLPVDRRALPRRRRTPAAATPAAVLRCLLHRRLRPCRHGRIDKLGGSINDRWGKLDILVANAGVLGVISPVGHVEAKVFEKVMTVNVTGHLAADPFRRSAAAASRMPAAPDPVVGAPHKCKPFWGPYSASKAAVEALARTWAGETRTQPLRVNICRSRRHPHSDARPGGSRRGSGDRRPPVRDRQPHPANGRPRPHPDRPDLPDPRTALGLPPEAGLISASKRNNRRQRRRTSNDTAVVALTTA
jgi:NAD(P)-dependent dehydrogenase (short-subunit alcohol dehydrogenase family)